MTLKLIYSNLNLTKIGKRLLSSTFSNTTNNDISTNTEIQHHPNPFVSYLQKMILMKGPLTVGEYMKEALGNPKWVRF